MGTVPLRNRSEGLDLEGILNVLRSIDEADVEREAARFSTRDVDHICYGFPQIRDSDPAKPKAAGFSCIAGRRDMLGLFGSISVILC